MGLSATLTSSLTGGLTSPLVGLGAINLTLLNQPATPEVFYSMAQLDGYEGSCIRVVNPDTTTETDIGFSNGYISQSELTAAQGSSDYLAVKTWYDQSGNDYHATAKATDAEDMAAISAATSKVSGRYATWFYDRDNSDDETLKYFDIPTGATGDRQDFTVISVISPTGTTYDRNAIWSLGTGFTTSVGHVSVLMGSSYNGFALVANGSTADTQATALNPRANANQFMCVRSNATNCKVMVDTNETTETALTSETFAGGSLGALRNAAGTAILTSQYPYTGGMSHFALYLDGAMSNAVVEAARDECDLVFKSGLAYNLQIAVVGDSITKGFGAESGFSPWRQTSNILNTSAFYSVTGIGGASLNGLYTNRANTIGSRFISGLDRNIFVTDAGINDVTANDSAANMFTEQMLWVAYGHSIGYDDVAVGILLPNGNQTTGQNDVRVAYNALIRNVDNQNQYGFSVTDYENQTALLDPDDTDYYIDKVHLTETGSALRAAEQKATIEAILASTVPAAVDDLAVDTIAETTADLSWTYPDNGGSAFKKISVYKSTDGSSYSLVTDTLHGGEASYQVTGLTGSTLYYFDVRYTNGTGEAAASNIASDTTTSGVFDPLTDTEGTLIAGWHAVDSSITESSGNVSQINDITANGYHLTVTGVRTGDDTQNSLNVFTCGTTPEATNTDIDTDFTSDISVVIVFKTNGDTDWMPVSNSGGAAYPLLGISGSGSAAYRASSGLPTYYNNGTLKSFATRGDVYTEFNTGTYNVAIIKGADFSAYTGLNVFKYSQSAIYMNAHNVAAIYVIDAMTANDVTNYTTFLTSQWGL